MIIHHASALTVLALSVSTFGCQQVDVSHTEVSSGSIWMTEASEKFLNNFWVTDADGHPVIFLDTQQFWSIHRSEILETYEMVDSSRVDDIGVALIRFSVGSQIVRASVWMRNLDTEWWPMATQYFSTYSEDYLALPGELREEADIIIEKEKEWTEESEDIWWMW